MGRSEIDRPFFIYTWSFSLSSLRLHTSPFHNLVCGNHRSVFCCLIVFATIHETFLNVD